jgi:hypothetical protein
LAQELAGLRREAARASDEQQRFGKSGGGDDGDGSVIARSPEAVRGKATCRGMR